METDGPRYGEVVTRIGGIEAISKYAAVVTIGLYLIGLLTVNVYLHTIVSSDLSLGKVRFVYTGAWVVASLVLTFALGGFALAAIMELLGESPEEQAAFKEHMFESEEKFMESMREVRSRLIGDVPGLYYIRKSIQISFGLIPWACFAVLLNEHGVPLKSSIGHSFALYFIGTLAAVILYYWPYYVGRPDSNVKVVLRPFVIPVCLIFLLAYSSLFAIYAYPQIPDEFGGGKPKRARLIFTSEAMSMATKLGIGMNTGQVSDEVSLLLEEDSYVVVRLLNGSIIQLDRKALLGMEREQ